MNKISRSALVISIIGGILGISFYLFDLMVAYNDTADLDSPIGISTGDGDTSTFIAKTILYFAIGALLACGIRFMYLFSKKRISKV